MLKKILKVFAVVLLLAVSAGFLKFKLLGKVLDKEAIRPYLTTSTHQHNIELTYLGCAGFVISYQQHSILCDPFISNPGILNFGKQHTAWTAVLPEAKLKSINLVTVSHGHYDHCYDAQTLFPYIQPDSKFIADISVENQLHAIFTNTALQPIGLNYHSTQQWIYNKDSSFRIFPLQSIHNPHIGSIELFKGNYPQPLAAVPERAWQWQKGEDYSYLIDVVRKDSILYRIALVNGNLAETGVEALKTLSAQRTADLQLQIFWKEKLVTDNMLQVYSITHPKQIILHHWNNFFVSFDQPLEYLRDSHLPEVLEKYNKQGIKVSMMLPFTSTTL